MSLISRIILYLVIIAIVLFIGFWLIIIASFGGSGDFYVPFIFISGISFLALTGCSMFKPGKNKLCKSLWILLLSATVISCAVYEGKNAYDRNILRIGEHSVDLRTFAPFSEKSKVAKLDQPSTLKLETNLPRLDGATALYPLYAAFAQAVYPENNYDIYSSEVACNNTIGSYGLLINKKTDIIFVAKPSEEQLKEAEEKGVEFSYTAIGKEAFVFFVNAHNPVEDLTTEQIQKIYSGEIKNWKDVGGKDEKIRAFQRNENSGSQTTFLKFMEGKTIMTPPEENVASGMGHIINQTADYTNYHNAIGFSFRFYANEMVNNKEIKILKVNGIYPDMESIRKKTYPLASSFYAITLSDNTKSSVQELLNWILSEQGQFLVKKTGYCPLNESSDLN